MKNKVKKIISLTLVFFILIGVTSTTVKADGIIDELLGISFYYYHYTDDNGNIKDDSEYTWGSKDEKEQGLKISKTDLNKIHISINADICEKYKKYKPVLMWVHKADALMDATKYTDIQKWYKNKLEETFLIYAIPDIGKSIDVDINVPLKLNIGATGIINGGYYEVEFYDENSIPEQLKFAYEMQTYSIEDLEKYINSKMNDKIEEYYNADSGFRSNTDGFAIRNTDIEGSGGLCAGYSALSSAKFNKYPIVKEFTTNNQKFVITNNYSWFNNIYGDESIHSIKFDDENILAYDSPCEKINNFTFKAYPYTPFSTNMSSTDKAFYSLANYCLLENNKAVLLRGNMQCGDKIKWINLENRWSIINYLTSYIRKGKVFTVNISGKQGGHAIVGYRTEQINDDTIRLYCYDCNYPDDYSMSFIQGQDGNKELDENGAYKNVVWGKTDVYIDFTKNRKNIYTSDGIKKSIETFDFDSSHTSINENSKNGGVISFSLCKGDSFGIFNYGNEENEIIAYRAFPVINGDKTVDIRTFAFYKSGEVEEITNMADTNIQMDCSFIGMYKISNSRITLTKQNMKFVSKGSDYIDCYVSYNDRNGTYGKIKVRIPVCYL